MRYKGVKALLKENNFENINIDDFEKLEDTVAPAIANYNNYNYNIGVYNNIYNSTNTTVNNIFTFR